MPSTNPDCTKNKSHGDIYGRNYRNISDGVGVQKLLSNDSKGLINNGDIDRVSDEVTWIEEMLSNNPNCIESKSYSDNNNKNCDGDRVSGEQ